MKPNFEAVLESAKVGYNVCGEILYNTFAVDWNESCDGCGRNIRPQEEGKTISDVHIICIDCFTSISEQLENKE